MADNTTINAGTGGDTISTDDIAGVKVQRVKVQYGVDGVATDVNASTPLPVTVLNMGPGAAIGDVSANIATVGGQTINLTDTGTIGVGIAKGGNSANVKAASTAAVAADPALVVAISPNNGMALEAGNLWTIASAVKNEDAVATTGDAGTFVLGVRQDADTSPVSADGDYHGLTFNSVGRLKVSTMPGDYVATTGNITANGQSVVCDVTRASNVNLYCTGTFAGVNCTFEGSIDGGTTYFGIQAVRTNANTVELTTGVLGAAPAYAWEASVNALTHIRVRATAFTSGTQAWRILPGAYATEPIPAVQTHAVTVSSGTVTAVTGITNAINIGTKTTGGATSFTLISAATTNATSVKASAGTLYSLLITNNGAAARYFKLYNKASAPTVGTDTPVATILIPAGGGASYPIPPQGIAFATGIAYAITGAGTVADTTAVAATEVFVNGSYA